MIINIHSKEIESKNTVKIIEDIKNELNEEVFHITDKSVEEWQSIIKSDEPIRFVGPVYWWGLGYEFDKWMQNVWTYGFAYVYKDGMPEGLLGDRKFEMHLVHGTPFTFSEIMSKNIEDRLKIGTFGFVKSSVDVKFYEAKM